MIDQQTNIKEVIHQRNFVVLDTETTGLHDGEICQIAIVDASGAVLLDSLVQTVHPIPRDAIAIHGISNDMVRGAPTFPQIAPRIRGLVEGRHILVYNAIYDRKMLHRSAEHAGIPHIPWKEFSTWHCVMEAYAQFWGDWNDYHQSYRWQRLSAACSQQGLNVQDAHSALGDCLMTLALVNKVWGNDKPAGN